MRSVPKLSHAGTNCTASLNKKYCCLSVLDWLQRVACYLRTVSIDQTPKHQCMLRVPDNFPVSVIMESRPSTSPWLDLSWNAVGICSIDNGVSDESSTEKIIKQGDIEQVIYSELKLRLYADECESYYHNLMSPQPGCFIVARETADGRPVPFLVTLSFDEAHAYHEGDDLVYSVPIPAELYRWAEAYVIENYLPVKRKKRKRKDWKQTS